MITHVAFLTFRHLACTKTLYDVAAHEGWKLLDVVLSALFIDAASVSAFQGFCSISNFLLLVQIGYPDFSFDSKVILFQ